MNTDYMMSKNKNLLLYHANCPDGFGSRFAFETKYGEEFDYIELAHNHGRFKGLPESFFENRKIVMADVAFQRQDAIDAHALADEFTIIDHHLSAMKDLEGLEFAHFDMTHSGSVLSWMHCFPGEPVPILLQYIEDRDLWKKKLPFTEEILLAIDSYERTFESWTDLNERMNGANGFNSLLKEGTAILRYNKVLREEIKRHVYYTEIKGHRVPVVNTPFLRSEILDEILEGELFSAGYHFDGEHFIFSLRSTNDKMDVSEIALKFPGGGGHRNASGFSVKTLDELNEEF